MLQFLKTSEIYDSELAFVSELHFLPADDLSAIEMDGMERSLTEGWARKSVIEDS